MNDVRIGFSCNIYLLKFIAFLFFFSIQYIEAVIPTETKIVYMDGQGNWDNCLPGIKRSVSAESGLLISHSDYGTKPYNTSKNCFLTITVPLGYRIRLKILDFDVRGDWHSCKADTLHIFDHDEPLNPIRLERLPIVERSPGPLLGQFCGRFPPLPPALRLNSSLPLWPNDGTAYDSHGSEWQKAIRETGDATIAESTHNTLTVWWHTDSVHDKLGASGKEADGFRLHWSSFRIINIFCFNLGHDECERNTEFRCAAAAECIPLTAACDSYADCADASDTNARLQLEHNCEHIPSDVFGQLTGLKKLLICVLLALGVACSCFFCCACFYFWRSSTSATNSARSSTLSAHKQQQQSQAQQQIDLQPTTEKRAYCNNAQSHSHDNFENGIHLNDNANHTNLFQQQIPYHYQQQQIQHPLPPNFSPPQVPHQFFQRNTTLPYAQPIISQSTTQPLLPVQLALSRQSTNDTAAQPQRIKGESSSSTNESILNSSNNAPLRQPPPPQSQRFAPPVMLKDTGTMQKNCDYSHHQHHNTDEQRQLLL